ncbi:hypothetical protein D3C75_576000 [compost metagenome]
MGRFLHVYPAADVPLNVVQNRDQLRPLPVILSVRRGTGIIAQQHQNNSADQAVNGNFIALLPSGILRGNFMDMGEY